MATPEAVAAAWALPPVRPVACDSGLINTSYLLVDADGRAHAVLQRLNTRIFRPCVHHDTAAVTDALRRQGMVAPELLRTRAGALWHEVDGEVWRAMTVVGRDTWDTVRSPAHARSAGALVARFHGALAHFDRPFEHVRPGAHDTDRHLATLAEAVDALPDHRLHAEVARLSDVLQAAWASLRADALRPLPTRVIHGDLKISNVRFDGERAVALIDLDTLAHGTLDVELGDAMRSWCGAAGEDVAEATFDLAIFEAAMTGYAAGAAAAEAPWGPTEAEWAAIVPGTQRIATELAARFAADALRESYFGWDHARFPAAGEHNLLRARGQASLAAAVARSRGEAESALRRARAAC
jgi:Ser/Thr protein kinase RdoA (MazF antagonist)